MALIETLLMLLNKTTDKTTRAIILQTYVKSYGPVPDKYADDVRKALERQCEVKMTNREAINRIEDHIRVHALSEPRADLIHVALSMAIEALKQPEIIRCKDCKHHWVHRCMDSIPTEICDLNQTFYDSDVDFCSLAEKRGEEE